MARRLLIFIMSILYALCLWGQSPGGVSGAELWHVATPTTVYLDSTYRWKDLSGDAIMGHVSGNANIEYKQARRFMQAFNFNPAFYFKFLSADSIISNLRHTNLSQATILGVFAPDSTSIAHNARIYSAYGRENENFSVFKESINGVANNLQYGVDTTLNLLADGENDVAFKQSALRTMTYQRSFVPNHSVWGEPTESSIIIPSNDNSNFIFCPELIAYGRELSHFERRKVESYLAIKYGITLRGSFYAPDSTLIWDSQTNNSYHNRVTAIAHYPASKLLQPLSTTSYEELPNCAIDSLCDSYYLRSSYNKPTSKRLLVMGREYGCPMPDNSYMIWGDNSASLEISANQSDTLWQVMNRKWKLYSNLPYVTNDTVTLVTSNISVDKIKEGVFNITRGISSSVSDITFGQNTSNDLHFSFTCPNDYPTFDVLVKPTRSSGYGFKFNTDGSIYTVGLTRNRVVYNDARNHRIDIYKRGDNLFLQVDGVGGLSKTLVVPVALMPHTFDPLNPSGSGMQPNGGTGAGSPVIDIIPEPGYSCKGALHVYGGESLLLSNFRVDGFCNTYNQVELSYNIANALKKYRNKRTFLLVSNDEDIDPENNNTYIVQSDGFDKYRNKIMFHNVPFKNEGPQYFTFASYDGFIVDLIPTGVTCNNGVSRNDGKILVNIKCGSPLFKCSMTENDYEEEAMNADPRDGEPEGGNPSSGETEDPLWNSGLYFGDMCHLITGLHSSEYHVTVKQMGGINIFANNYQNNNERYAKTNVPITYVSWQLTDTVSQYYAGGVMQNGQKIGFEVDDTNCYLKIGNTHILFYSNLHVGDSLSIKFDNDSVRFKVKDNQRSVANVYGSVTFKAQFGIGSATLANVKLGNNAEITESDESVIVEEIRPMIYEADVTIGDCGEESFVTTSQPRQNVYLPRYNQSPSIGDFSSDKGKLTVTPDGYRNFNAELRTKETESAQLLVFDAAGRLITQTNMSPGEVKYASFSVPGSGVYIVKVLTSDDEYTWKLLSE